LLANVENLNKVESFGAYAFLNNGMASADLSGAKHIGTFAFMKPEKTAFKVTLGEDLETMGDNPFALCDLEPFCILETEDFNGITLEDRTYTYDISDTVKVIDGSLYCQLETGLALITYVGIDDANAVVADDTIRITAMAFADSDVQMVTMPETVFAIGHKAFFDCDKLHTVVFGSYEAPILEEEFDRTWYESFKNIPGSGDFGSYKDYNGNDIQITGMGLIPYYMWNSTDGLYSNVFYGASFVDYVGYVDTKLTMIRPVNGTRYDSFIYDQYFDVAIDGAQAPDKTTLAAIRAIKQIPERVTYAQRALVEKARALYDKIATLEQKALVSNYADLVSAEQRIVSLTPADEPVETPTEEPEEKGNGGVIALIVFVCVIFAAVAAAVVYVIVKARLEKRPIKEVAAEFLQTVKTVSVKVWNVIVLCAKKVWSWIKPVAKKIWSWIKPAAQKAWPVIAKWAKKAGKFLAKHAMLFAGLCVTAWKATVAWIKKLFAKKEKAASEVKAETAETPAVTETPEQETAVKTKRQKPARKVRAKKIRKPRKKLQIDPKIKKIVMIVLGCVAAAALVAVIVMAVIDMSSNKAENPYELNDAENYSVSVKFDANGGFFTTNTSVIVDSFNPEKLPQQNGKAQIALVAPDDAARDKNAFTAINNGYFLAGWYRERIEAGTDAAGNPAYTYSGKWDFEKDVFEIDAAAEHTAREPVLTLYAAWIPMFQIEFYDLASGELMETMSYDPSEGKALTIPAWDEKTGAIEMHNFPQKSGFTFNGAFYDAEGKMPVETETVEHLGSVDYATGTAKDPAMKLYVDWMEGEWFHIYNAEQFLDNASVNGSYVIHEDLDFTGKNWPTSLMHGSFAGTIQGNGHTFRNITFKQTNKSKVNSGLFGQLADTASISDLTFENVTFTIEGGTRVSGATYGLLAGSASDQAVCTNVQILSSTLQIDSDCYFGTDDYTIGLVCGMGSLAVDYSGITCIAVGDKPESVTITVSDSTVTVEFAAG
jgi:hypothetical protein